MATIITVPCIQCSKTSTVEITAEEKDALDQGQLIQVALADRDDDFRELVLTGTHPACWDAMFPDEEELTEAEMEALIAEDEARDQELRDLDEERILAKEQAIEDEREAWADRL